MTARSDTEFYDEYHQCSVTAEDELKIRERQATLRKLLANARGPVLVVGCGSVGEMSVTPRGVKALGIDISSVAVEKSRLTFPQYTYVVADAVRLPFKDAQFKTILCSEVIEHVRHSDRALAEFWRVLDTYGCLT
jgi:ubiquinone/menaquinone biosynthesis C-methylase UbiE